MGQTTSQISRSTPEVSTTRRPVLRSSPPPPSLGLADGPAPGNRPRNPLRRFANSVLSPFIIRSNSSMFDRSPILVDDPPRVPSPHSNDDSSSTDEPIWHHSMPGTFSQSMAREDAELANSVRPPGLRRRVRHQGRNAHRDFERTSSSEHRSSHRPSLFPLFSASSHSSHQTSTHTAHYSGSTDGTAGATSDFSQRYQLPDNVPSQAYLLGRLLAIAASITASSLVGSRSSRGELHSGSNQASEGGGDSSFSGFVDSLLRGAHASELAYTMFGDHEAHERPSFFRMFRFPQEDNGLVPVLIVGMRATDQDPSQPPDYDSETMIDIRPDESTAGSSTRLLSDIIDQVEHLGQDRSLHRTPHDEPETAWSSSPSSPQGGRTDDTSSFRSRTTTHPVEFENLDEENGERNGSTAGTDSRAHGDRQGSNTLPRRPRQSWMVYVVGGAYHSNHPIFFAPSLLTDNPTYEDLLLVEGFLGDARPQTATQQSVDASGGKTILDESSPLVLENERCSICLSNFTAGDTCRQLSCEHNFHQFCVDKWLTSSHNSCPLCRTRGVDSVNDPVDGSVEDSVGDSTGESSDTEVFDDAQSELVGLV